MEAAVVMRLLVLLALCCARLVEGDDESQRSDEVITLKVYWEALCPTCHDWFLHKYKPLWEKPDFKKLFKVEHYPYGNARTSPAGVIQCQHGAKECQANMMVTCSQRKIENNEAATRFVFCALERLAEGKSVQLTVEKCTADTNVATNIINCYSSVEGEQMQASVAALTPNHRYVPWVTDETGKEIKSAEENLQKYLCSQNQGQGRPDECNFQVLVRSEGKSPRSKKMAAKRKACANPWWGTRDKFAGKIRGMSLGKPSEGKVPPPKRVDLTKRGSRGAAKEPSGGLLELDTHHAVASPHSITAA